MIGSRLGPYEITAELGKGGMGVVYRARDAKLDREVAIKVLPPETSADPEWIARFQREARTLASLQHANIASVYGFEESKGARYLVMELVEGEDLAERLTRGPVNTDWSPDGSTVLFLVAGSQEDVWTLDLSGDEPQDHGLLVSPYREIHAQFSPDGEWIAYASNESGALQVYLVDFPGLTRKIQVTRESASMPRWTRGGTELLVLNAARELRSIPMQLEGGEWEIGEPQTLFRTGIPDYTIRTHQYDASRDGETIVVLDASFRERARSRPITVVSDWRQLLGR